MIDRSGKALGMKWSIYWKGRSVLLKLSCGPVGVYAYKRYLEAHIELSFGELYLMAHRSPIRSGLYLQRWKDPALRGLQIFIRQPHLSPH